MFWVRLEQSFAEPGGGTGVAGGKFGVGCSEGFTRERGV